MNKKICSFIVAMICFALMIAATVTATATGGEENTGTESSQTGESGGGESGSGSGEGSGEESESGSGEGSGEESESGSGEGSGEGSESGSGEGSGEGTGDGSGEGSGEETGNGEGTGAGSGNDTDGGDKEQEDTNNDDDKNDTSSKPSSGGGVTSQGAGGGKTFIDETGSGSDILIGSVESGNNTQTDERPADDDENIDFFEGKVSTFAGKIYKVIWLPIVLSVICIAALIYVNVVLKNRLIPAQAHGASRRSRSGVRSKTSASRRR